MSVLPKTARSPEPHGGPGPSIAYGRSDRLASATKHHARQANGCSKQVRGWAIMLSRIDRRGERERAIPTHVGAARGAPAGRGCGCGRPSRDPVHDNRCAPHRSRRLL